MLGCGIENRQSLFSIPQSYIRSDMISSSNSFFVTTSKLFVAALYLYAILFCKFVMTMFLNWGYVLNKNQRFLFGT
jgi:hypothetical protein